ncbi:MAG: hypothetical protein L6U61_03060 [Bacteroidales bacterium]|nr:MAG: hypothetical protein L6U61_03060 [Bacteroidales bacterium]
MAYLRHADSRGVSSPGTLRCATRTGLRQSAADDAPRAAERTQKNPPAEAEGFKSISVVWII